MKRSRELRASWGVTPDEPVVMAVIQPSFGASLPVVARAFASIRQQLRTARLVLVGGGAEVNRMSRIFPEHVYCGEPTDEALARHYASAEFFLFPSDAASTGRVLIEAMASGLPVLTYRCALPTFFMEDCKSGYLVESGSVDRFVRRAREVAFEHRRWGEVGVEARRLVVARRLVRSPRKGRAWPLRDGTRVSAAPSSESA